jgi:hypothetical protein
MDIKNLAQCANLLLFNPKKLVIIDEIKRIAHKKTNHTKRDKQNTLSSK